ncbi:hypothetical protein B0H10DRAFT_1963694 [Mycena sp. CBHHK59/15]|nr:hypothetical protein B0H10DRAFT_1963694 [Mycena sp. CBHHK59/15]
MLPHPEQVDFVHCGVYTANTIEHAVFNTKLITVEEARDLRMEWFEKFVESAKTSPAVPLFMNHNFPELGPEDFFEQDISDNIVSAPLLVNHSSSHVGREPFSEQDIMLATIPIATTPSSQSISKILSPPTLPDLGVDSSLPLADPPGLVKSVKGPNPVKNIEIIPSKSNPAQGAVLETLMLITLLLIACY